MEKVTQASLIIEYLEEFGSITPLEAIRDIGCYRLSARISDIKDMGIPIKTDMVNVKNRRGKYNRIARYSLLRGETQ